MAQHSAPSRNFVFFGIVLRAIGAQRDLAIAKCYEPACSRLYQEPVRFGSFSVQIDSDIGVIQLLVQRRQLASVTNFIDRIFE
jgi:hypothetical protein